MATELSPTEPDPAQLAAAMAQLKLAVMTLRKQVKTAQSQMPTKPVAPKPEARAAIRQKAKTGALKAVRTPAPQTGPVGPRATGRVKLAEAQSQELEAVEGWVPLSELAAQNESNRPRRKQ